MRLCLCLYICIYLCNIQRMYNKLYGGFSIHRPSRLLSQLNFISQTNFHAFSMQLLSRVLDGRGDLLLLLLLLDFVIGQRRFDRILGQHCEMKIGVNGIGKLKTSGKPYYSLEQCNLTGGSDSSLAISVFFSLPASSMVLPFTHSVASELDAIAEPQPNVLNFASMILPFSSTLICSFITSPQAGAPTSPVPTDTSFLSIEPTLRGFS